MAKRGGAALAINGTGDGGLVITEVEKKPPKSLLDEAIAKHKIPPWPYECAYDRIIVYSVPEDSASRDTFVKDGLLVKPESTKSRDENMTPRGILVSAGLGARDVLRSHGMGLGHMLWIARLSPWRHEVDVTEDGTIEFLFLRVGDIVGSETLQKAIQDGRVSIEMDAEGKHFYRYKDEGDMPRFDPPSYVA